MCLLFVCVPISCIMKKSRWRHNHKDLVINIIDVCHSSMSSYLHFPLTWKYLIAFTAFHCSVSPSLVSFQILVTRIWNTAFKRCWWQCLILECFRIAQNAQVSSLSDFKIIMFREYKYVLLNSLILGILLRTGFMCNCPLESRLRPTNPFCSCHKLTLNPGVLM